MNRRDVLRSAAGVALLAPLPAMAGTEAEPLIALAQRWRELDAEYSAILVREDAAHNAGDKASEAAAEAARDAISDAQGDLWRQIADTPARSWVGVAVKLRVAAAYIGLDMDSPDGDDLLSQEQRLAMSALADAERLLAG